MKAKEIFFYSLGALIVIGFFTSFAIMLFLKTSPETTNLWGGALIGAFGTVVGWFYGSSKGSSDKNEMLNNKS
ncbi:MAG: hypothetical protein NTZ83_02235 [Candidatus Pacearchaeota archaeon]|jgi:H+/Cl- antiporter ClcA|nr:hypothetical protein [Candidatus Pacearchaeota archaeon]